MPCITNHLCYWRVELSRGFLVRTKELVWALQNSINKSIASNQIKTSLWKSSIAVSPSFLEIKFENHYIHLLFCLLFLHTIEIWVRLENINMPKWKIQFKTIWHLSAGPHAILAQAGMYTWKFRRKLVLGISSIPILHLQDERQDFLKESKQLQAPDFGSFQRTQPFR